ncbi:MAG: hypothetical protein WCC12_04470, partial [Anaerolineales bacterium]
CFLKTLWDTDTTDLPCGYDVTEFHGKNRNKKAPFRGFREIRVQANSPVGKKDGNNDLRNTLLQDRGYGNAKTIVECGQCITPTSCLRYTPQHRGMFCFRKSGEKDACMATEK